MKEEQEAFYDFPPVSECETLDELLSMMPEGEPYQAAWKCWYTIRDHEKIICSVSGGWDSDIMLDLIIRCGGVDALEPLKMRWDLIIAHPPCTYLTNAGAVRMRVKGEIVSDRYEKAMKAREFFLKFLSADCPRIAVENPTPMKLVDLPPYTQAIQPYEYGHPYSKRTCLWLKGLPPLQPTDILDKHEPYVNGGCKDAHGNYRRFQGRKERDPKTRSKTFPGIARAMAQQWGGICDENK